jgi:hypothetical protein
LVLSLSIYMAGLSKRSSRFGHLSNTGQNFLRKQSSNMGRRE